MFRTMDLRVACLLGVERLLAHHADMRSREILSHLGRRMRIGAEGPGNTGPGRKDTPLSTRRL
jgi:hypothetical protein